MHRASTDFAPPAEPGQGRSVLWALLAHALLFLALALATRWNTQEVVSASAELWSAVPMEAAPAAVEPTPAPPEPTPEPPPAPKPQPAPPPPAPDPQAARDDEIALKKQQEQKKAEEQKRLAQLEAQKKERLKAEQEKADKLKAEKLKAEKQKADKLKAEKEKAEQLKAEKQKVEKEKSAKAEAERKKQEARDRAEAVQAEARRQENMKRIQGLAGASGAATAKGTALQSSGPSASYMGKLVGRIKPNITFTGDTSGNPRAEVEIRVSPDGTVLSARISKTSGNRAWDEAVVKAVEKTGQLPRDTDGRMPETHFILGFRPLD